MRLKGLFVFLVSAALATVVSAQTKVSGTLQCPKAGLSHAVEVGDEPGHVITLGKVGGCTWSKTFEMAGVAVRDGYSIATGEIRSGKSTESGIHAGTMANGDKYFVRFRGNGTAAKDGSGSMDGTWSFTSGTGKLKGLTGKGTYKSTTKADGTGTSQVEGDYKTP
jgi:hypothetical protein